MHSALTRIRMLAARCTLRLSASKCFTIEMAQRRFPAQQDGTVGCNTGKGRQAHTFHSFDASEPRHSRLLLRNTHSDLLSSVFGSAHGKPLDKHPTEMRVEPRYQCRTRRIDAAVSTRMGRACLSSVAAGLRRCGYVLARLSRRAGLRFREHLQTRVRSRTHLGT